MEQLKKDCEETYQEVVHQLDQLEGTEYTEIANNVKIGLHNRLQDIVSCVASMIKDNPSERVYKGVEYIRVDGKEFRVACIATCNKGEGRKAIGTVGVAFGEKVAWNTGMSVQCNKVNFKTTKIWGMLLAMRIAVARNYERILIVMDDYASAQKILDELNSGKLSEEKGYETLVEKFKKYKEGGLEIRAAVEVEHAQVMAGAGQTFKVAEKEAKKALEIAKKETKN